MVYVVPTVYNSPSVYKTAGGGGVIPVPDGYKELLYIRPNVDENSIIGNNEAFCDLGPGNNTDVWEVNFLDITKVLPWLQNNSNTQSHDMMVLSNGKTRYLSFRKNANNLECSFNADGYYSGSPTIILPDIYNFKIDKTKALFGTTSINNGGGAISAGIASYTYPFGNGTDIMPIKIGVIKIWDQTETNLLHDWRPVEKLGGGDNRFGFYDIVNNVFKASSRSGRYFVPGPEV